MRGKNRPTPVDGGPAVRFEGVRGVVEPRPEDGFHEQVGQPVDEELHARITNRPATRHEAAAEHAIETFVE